MVPFTYGFRLSLAFSKAFRIEVFAFALKPEL